MRHLILALLILLPTLAWGAERLAVLNIEGASSRQTLYYTDLLRGYATRHTQFMVLTRENIETLVEPGTLEKCVDQCEVVVGRLLGSHQVISGVMFGGSKLILKLHDTKSGALVRSVVVSGGIEGALESSFLELMGLEEGSFDDLEARYFEAKRERYLKAEREDRAKREREERERREEEAIKERERRERMEKIREDIRQGLSWTIDSPFLRLHGRSEYYAKEFHFVSKPQPHLWLEGGYLYASRPSGGYLFANDEGKRISFYIDQVSTVEAGVGYDDKGRKLTPMQLKEMGEKSAWGNSVYPQDEDMWVYANQELLREDLEAYYRHTKNKMMGVVIAPLGPMMTVFLGLGFRKMPSVFFEEQKALTAGLITTNILFYGLSWWLITDTNEYHYPNYIEDMGWSSGRYLRDQLRKSR